MYYKLVITIVRCSRIKSCVWVCVSKYVLRITVQGLVEVKKEGWKFVKMLEMRKEVKSPLRKRGSSKARGAKEEENTKEEMNCEVGKDNLGWGGWLIKLVTDSFMFLILAGSRSSNASSIYNASSTQHMPCNIVSWRSSGKFFTRIITWDN